MNAAATTGDASMVEMLLLQGARVDARDQNGDTPLLKAAYFGHTKVCELLLDIGNAKIEDWPNFNFFKRIPRRPYRPASKLCQPGCKRGTSLPRTRLTQAATH